MLASDIFEGFTQVTKEFLLKPLVFFPKKPGVYIVKFDETVIYIGHSKNIYQRWRLHQLNYQYFDYLDSENITVNFIIQSVENKQERIDLEKHLIQKHFPMINHKNHNMFLKDFKRGLGVDNCENTWIFVRALEQYQEIEKHLYDFNY